VQFFDLHLLRVWPVNKHFLFPPHFVQINYTFDMQMEEILRLLASGVTKLDLHGKNSVSL
jgi:hypothetical protein